MKRAVLVCGGRIEEDFALAFLKETKFDFVIAADRGLLFLQKHGICPTHIVGDFDSADASCLAAYRGNPQVEIRTFRPEKDWTDSEIAAETALEQGCEELVILGGTGTRIDHVLGNIQLLALLLERGARGYLLDPHNCIFLTDGPLELKREEQWGRFVSLFAYGGDVTGLTLQGMKYPLEEFTLGSVGTRTISNEIQEEIARIRFRTGRLLVMETRD